MASELRHGDGITCDRVVTNWDLAFVIPITRPLLIMISQSASDHRSTHSHTHEDTYMCGRLRTDWGGVVRVTKDMASTNNRCLKRKAKYPVLVFEKDGYLQRRLVDILSSSDRRIRGPHRLRDYCTPIHDAAVKYTTIWQVKWSRDMGKVGIDEEEIALSGGGSRWGNGGALQQVQKVLLGCSAPEGLGYVPVDEKCPRYVPSYEKRLVYILVDEKRL